MRDRYRETRLVFPSIGPLYDRLGALAYPFIRFVTGAMLVPHGYRKLVDPGTQQGVIGLFHKLGLEPAEPIFWVIALVESVGGLLLAIGLLTRPAALAIFVEMMVISFGVYWPNGYFAGTRGYEHTLLWGLMALACAWRGGGNLSVDRLIGREF